MSIGYRTMSMAEMSTILRNLQRSLASLQSQVNSLSGGGGGIGGGATSHNLLSTTHSDTEADAVVQGDLIVGGATPTWERLALGASGTFLRSDGSNPSWLALQASDIDTLALLLDQTTPQTVVNGIPLLDKEYDDFSNPDEFVNKGYVDWVATAIGANYYMTDDTDGDTGYKICSLTPSAGSETYVEASGVADGQLLGTWISDVGEAPAKLPRGMYDWFIFAEKTSGTKTLRLYWELYERKTDTSEVLIATSSESNELKMGEKTSYVVPLALDSDYTPDSGSRIVGKIYASVSGGGNAPTVKIYYQGASGSRWEIPSTTEILNNIYIKRDEIGIDDDDILQVDQAAGLTAGNLVRATSSGLESRTDAEILAQLSGKATSAFNWNYQKIQKAFAMPTGDPHWAWGVESLVNNVLYRADKKWTITASSYPYYGSIAYLFSASSDEYVRWFDTDLPLTIEVDFGSVKHYFVAFGFSAWDLDKIPKDFKIEVYKTDTSSWETVADITNNTDWFYLKVKTANSVGKIRWTFTAVSGSYLWLSELFAFIPSAKIEDKWPFITRDGGNIYGYINVQAQLRCDSFRIDQTPTAGTFTPDAYIIISCNGTNYKVPVKAV